MKLFLVVITEFCMHGHIFAHTARSTNCLFSLKGLFIDVQDAPEYVKVVPQFGRNDKPSLLHGSLGDKRSVRCLDVVSHFPTCTGSLGYWVLH